ncbi:MAG: universal stress protein [Desulfobacterales bacterium]|nr:universal stress protein [Desulfobacterales bacterium]
MFQTILFATSATGVCDHAARVAFEMAKRYGAELTLLHIIGVPSRGYSQMVRDVKTGETVPIDDDYCQWVEEEIRTHYRRQLADYDRVRIELALGYPHREILRYLRKNNPDIVIMGGATDPEASGYKKVMAGSTLHYVAKHSPCPVLVVARMAASFWGGISNIVYGTDFSKASDAAFEYAVKIARALDCELHLFHAVDISSVHGGKLMEQELIEANIRTARNRIRGRYVKQLGDFKNYSVEVWEGLPYVEIVKYAREKQADLIVMAHHAREADADNVRLGSNMEQVLMRANCPVLSVNRLQPE